MQKEHSLTKNVGSRIDSHVRANPSFVIEKGHKESVSRACRVVSSTFYSTMQRKDCAIRYVHNPLSYCTRVITD